MQTEVGAHHRRASGGVVTANGVPCTTIQAMRSVTPECKEPTTNLARRPRILLGLWTKPFPRWLDKASVSARSYLRAVLKHSKTVSPLPLEQRFSALKRRETSAAKSMLSTRTSLERESHIGCTVNPIPEMRHRKRWTGGAKAFEMRYMEVVRTVTSVMEHGEEAL